MKYVSVFLLTSFLLTPLFAKEQLPLTAEEQRSLTPEQVLELLLEGNKNYQAGTTQAPNIQPSIQAATTGQYPMAVILSCLDSRVPVELVFDQGIGDIFVGRVAGNVENEDQLGSMEFATNVAGAKVVMVLGHEQCGAVKGACDGVELGNLTALLEKIQPAVDAVDGHEGNRTSKNPEFVQEVIEVNVQKTVEDIRESSPLLAEMEKNGEIIIVGALYSLKDGSVRVLE
jgi:carbonic anhydrase